MSLNKLLKAISVERFFAGQAIPLASRALVVVAALVVAPAIHADCLPSAQNGWHIPFYMSTHNDITHAVSYTKGYLVEYPNRLAYLPSLLYGDPFPQLFSDRVVPGGPSYGLSTGQPFDIGQADQIGVAITRSLQSVGGPSSISVTLTLDSWGHTKYTFAGACDASTNLLYGSYDNNTMVVISFGAPFPPSPPLQ